MRIDYLALYQRALLGGIGGLLGWALINLFVHVSSEGAMLYVKAALTGALIGLALGAMTGAWDGLFRDRSRQRLLNGLRVGALLGLAGGCVGLLLGEVVCGMFQWIGGWLPLLPRALGWAVFGALVGVIEGAAKRMRQKLLFGAYGGMLGGLIGGSTYESLAGFFQFIGVGRAAAGALGGAVGLVLLGMFIGAMVALVEDLLRSAWLVFTSGRFEGQTRTLDSSKEETILGRDEMADICILGDPAVQLEHARIVCQGGGFVIEALDGEVLVRPAGREEFTPVTRHDLKNGDMFQLGSQRARFQTGKARETS